MDKNFIEHMFMTAITGMCTTKWHWPIGWSYERKQKFLQDCLEFAEQRELFEECAIIRDVEKELKAK